MTPMALKGTTLVASRGPSLTLEPEKPRVPFLGVGRTVGGSTTPSAAEPTVATPLNTAPAPSMGLVVDGTLPPTSIQLSWLMGPT
ncbi:hypothetical protein F0562_014397 [Nyssa sinensis]|uniref:Uncharacterized protein n=1 Tax=Nyssa sinensis TaxID=561372 RepID=A0A5J4ZSV2_9ASTE|nr:hypothetical protein F0562_014397 [Nyssa sinensis]